MYAHLFCRENTERTMTLHFGQDKVYRN